MGILGIFRDRGSAWMEAAAGAVLIGVMLLIGADIVGRVFGCPVPGTYEIVSIAGGLIVGLSLPATSRARGHVAADFLVGRLPEKPRAYLSVFTRLIGMFVFILAGFGMVWMGFRLKASGEVTAVLSLPLHYAVYAIGAAFWVQCVVLFAEMMGAVHGKTR